MERSACRIIQEAQNLRKNETEAEKILWERLRNNQFGGYKFRRQHPISLFIADFYCHKLKIIIEIDGEYHNNFEQIIKDEERTEILKKMGLDILRFTNEEVKTALEEVMQKIGLKIEEQNPEH